MTRVGGVNSATQQDRRRRTRNLDNFRFGTAIFPVPSYPFHLPFL